MKDDIKHIIANTINRRTFLSTASLGLGSLALGALAQPLKLFGTGGPEAGGSCRHLI